MILFDIKTEIDKLEDTSKDYKYLYKDFGFELGFGKKGQYKGHSHYCFCDIMLSKNILTKDYFGGKKKGQLLIVPPLTFMDDVTIDDFFFLKFCPTSKKVDLPDKTNAKLNDNKIQSYENCASLKFDWYKTSSEKSKLEIKLIENELSLNFIGFHQFIIKF